MDTHLRQLSGSYGRLAQKSRGKFLHMLKKAYAKGELAFDRNIQHLADPKAFGEFIESLRAKDWILHTEKPFAGARQVFQYPAATFTLGLPSQTSDSETLPRRR